MLPAANGSAAAGEAPCQDGPALQLIDRGYEDIIPVAPPGAPLSRSSRLREDQLGKVPAEYGPNGWHGFNWRAHKATRADAARWDRLHANIGLRATRYPAVDIDIDEDGLAAEIAQLAQAELGPAPVRRSRAGRRLLVYRTAEPFGKSRLTFTLDGVASRVEVLADGQQYLVHGRHPGGVDYRWEGQALQTLPAEELSAITGDQVNRFLEQVETRFRAVGVSVERGSATTAGNRSPLTPVQLDALAAPGDTEEERARWASEAADALAGDERYGEYPAWQALARVLRQAYGAGLDHLAAEKFEELSQTFPKYDPEAVQRVLGSLGRDTAAMGYGVLLARAQARGYILPEDHPWRAENEFDADRDGPPAAEVAEVAGEDSEGYARAAGAIAQLKDPGTPTFIFGVIRAKQLSAAVATPLARALAEALLRRRLEEIFGRGADRLLRPGGVLEDARDPFQHVGGKRLLRLADAAESNLAREWLVDGLVPMAAVGEIIGDYSVGKTLVALDIALSVGFGLPVFGYTVRQVPVLYLAYEGLHGIWARVAGWLHSHGFTSAEISSDELSRLLAGRFLVAADPPRFDHVDIEQGLLETIESQSIGLVIIDTRSKSLGGEQSEDKNDTAAGVNALLSRIAALTGCTFISAHHIGHLQKQRGRGASAWTQGVDFSWVIIGSAADFGAGQPVSLLPIKMRDAETPQALSFKLSPIAALTLDGHEMTGATIEEASQRRPPSLRAGLLEEVRRHPGQTKNQLIAAVGGNKAALLREIARLIDGGELEDLGTLNRSSLHLLSAASEFARDSETPSTPEGSSDETPPSRPNRGGPSMPLP